MPTYEITEDGAHLLNPSLGMDFSLLHLLPEVGIMWFIYIPITLLIILGVAKFKISWTPIIVSLPFTISLLGTFQTLYRVMQSLAAQSGYGSGVSDMSSIYPGFVQTWGPAMFAIILSLTLYFVILPIVLYKINKANKPVDITPGS